VIAPRISGAIAIADFRERVRRSGFWLIIGAAAYLGYTVNAGFWTMNLGVYRAVPGSASIGSLIALLGGLLFSWVGFFFVRGSVDRDRRTGVGLILAATPMSASGYTLAKTISNFAVLTAMVMVLAMAALVMVVATGSPFALGPLLSPFLFLTLPLMALTAAAAVAFETIPGLRGIFGSILYILLWAGVATAGIDSGSVWLDVLGLNIVYQSQLTAVSAIAPDAEITGLSLQIDFGRELTSFDWTGVRWTGEMLASRAVWVLGAVVLAGLAALPFDRFDEARWARALGPRARGARKRSRGRKHETSESPRISPTARHRISERKINPADLTPVVARDRFPLPRLVWAEIRLMVRGTPWWWTAIALVLGVAQLVNPVEITRNLLLAAWIWPVAMFSTMGCRASVHGVADLLDCAPCPIRRQLPASWLAGVVLAALVALPAWARFATAGRLDLVAALSGAVILVPSLALTLGVWSGTVRLFQVGYLFLWYLGPLNKLPALDYLGITDAAIVSGTPVACVWTSVLLIAGAWAGRLLQIRR
jgi:hypothetical protein